MKKQNRRRDGFTLVELLVVLVILVAIIGLVGPRILGAQSKADVKTSQVDLGNIKSTLELYFVDNKTFPSNEEGLKSLLEKPSDENRARFWDGPYLDSEDLPVDPWGNEYRYAYPPVNGKRDFPDLWSAGKDGQDGTDDDIVNWKKDSQSSTNGNS